MSNNTKRGFLASAGALATVVALALGGAAAHAAPPQPAPTASNVVITKLKQKDPLGDPADGTQQSGYAPEDLINGVTFEAYLVPGTQAGGTNDIGTNSGQQIAAGISVSQATTAIGGNAPAVSGTTGTSNPSGQVVWNNLPRGLYLVKENLATLPVGVTASAPFLLAVPLTNPTNHDAWLDTIYVYPKNSVVSGTKTVQNADKLIVGDVVTWTIATDIPLVQNPAFDPDAASGPASAQFIAPDAYRIDDTLTDTQLALAPALSGGLSAGITLTAGGTTLTQGANSTDGDYYITALPGGTAPNTTTTYQIQFTAAGLAKLATAVNADSTAKVEVTLLTTVLAANEITNSANFYPNQNAITENKPVVVPQAEVKYGSTKVNKKSTDNTVTALGGAQFQVFASETDAKSLTNPLKPAVATANYNQSTGTWTTPSNGEFVIEGLRFSNFADGVAQTKFVGQNCTDKDNGTPADDCTLNTKYQTYWLVETKALTGHQLLAEPVAFTITNTDGTLTQFELKNQKNTGGFILPLTGGMGTALLTIGGIAILATVLLVARRRRNEDAIAE